MNKLDQLEKLANEATQEWKLGRHTLSCSTIVGPYFKLAEVYSSIQTAEFIAAVSPKTIKEMIQLIRQQNEALKACLDERGTGPYWVVDAITEYALFEKGE